MGWLLAGLLLLAAPARAQTPPDLNTLRARAAQGDLEAQNAMGNAYTNALLGAPQDYAEALKWYRLAGDKGFAPAQFNLGLTYELGRGVPVDERQAFRFYLMSAEQGFAPAQFNVGNMYAAGRGIGQDLFEANLWYKQAAENGLVEAQFNLGLVYETGRGVKKDDALAARWYKVAAERGYPRAQYNYALLLEDGRGVGKDPVAAAALYRAAAEQGFAPAQINYGLVLAEGRGGVSPDPVQAYVWLSRAVQNGASPEARDALARSLTPEQLAAAQQAGGARVVPAPSATPAQAQAPDLAARLSELTQALAQAREANSRLAESNQRLEVDRARLTDELARAGSNPLVDQLRDQSRRLAEQVQALTADKEAAERQNAVLAAQVRDAERDLQAARTAAVPAAPAVNVSAYEAQITGLKARVDEATAALGQLQSAHADLTAAHQRLQQERDALAAAPSPTSGPAPDPAIVASLQRENARLNDEVKRSTLELLSLNRQLRSQTRPAAAGAPDTRQLDELTAKVEQATEQAARLGDENRRLSARVAELEAQPKPATDDTLPQKLTEAQQALAVLREQVTGLQAEKSALQQSVASLEQSLKNQSATAQSAGETESGLRRELAKVQAQVAERERALAANTQEFKRLNAENGDLTGRLTRMERELRSATEQAAAATELPAFRRRLSEVQARGEQLEQENRQLSGRLTEAQQTEAGLRSRVAGLEKEIASAATGGAEIDKLRLELAEAGRRAETLAAANADLEAQLGRLRPVTGTVDDLRRQLDDAKLALDTSNAKVTELTGANQRLEGQLVVARRDLAENRAMREELAEARRELGELRPLREESTRLREQLATASAPRPESEQAARDNERLTAALDENRRELAASRGRVDELEQQLAEALTVRTRAAADNRPTQAELDEANRTVEKLTGTVAELTAENQKLEQDLDNAQKTAAAALVAQSQAVTAASPDAFQMEISTLTARLKQLEAQVEEERSGAAREIATLAGQLQRTRETNRALTEANRALLSAKDSDTAAVRDETGQLEARIRDLTAVNEELRRQGQQQAADLAAATAERETLRRELGDARQVATVLPGLSDEKAALQERLEAVGGQLVQLQRDHDELQKTHADLTQQFAASRDATAKAEAELAALTGRVAEAEKADETHTRSVAELTQANQRLELEREDMRRLVESYRADIARLNEAVRAAEQQRAAAEQGGQQNIDALTAQLGQLRREIDAARANQARLTEAYATQERERQAIITQLRTENGALAARLNQAQGTLDQIAAAARLGTPASTIASGGTVPVRPTPAPAAEVRYHTVIEGDSLSRISLRYYGTPGRWQEIFQANRDVLQGSNSLRIGQQLRIP